MSPSLARIIMVDVDTALRASAYSGKKGTGGKGGGKKSSALEPFDPSSHAEKEKADAVSMWIVIFFGLSVALLMRFYMMHWNEWDETDTLASPLADDLSNSAYPPGFSSRQDSLNYTQLGIGLGLRFCIFSHGSPCHSHWSTLLWRISLHPILLEQ